MRKAIKPCGVCLCASVFLCIMVVGGYGRPPKQPPPKHRVHKKQRFVPAPPDVQPAPPHPNYIWIPRYRHPAGVHIGGFWRPPYKKGFVWVEGYWNENGEWVFGYWKPVKLKPGFIWVPGFWDGRAWVDGYWRPANKPGHTWVAGHFNSAGVWVKGHWVVK